jgi:hypothetical protein
MSNNLSTPSQDEIRLLVQELADVKELLRENSRQLQRIERQVKVAFPSAAASVRTARTSSGKRTHLDEPAAQKVIAHLKEQVVKGEQIETELKRYLVKPDLQIVARILGMTNTKLPPKDELVRRISTRLRQSVSVTAGFHEAAKSYGDKVS